MSEDRVTREKWPVLYWANRFALAGAGAGLVVWIAFLVYQAERPLSPVTRSMVNGIEGAAFLLGAASGLIFIVTGYVRLYKVHGLPGRAPRAPAGAKPTRRLAGIMVGIVVLVSATLVGWVHWGIGTALVFVVVIGGLYLVERWR
jgi:hypothetical protein